MTRSAMSLLNSWRSSLYGVGVSSITSCSMPALRRVSSLVTSFRMSYTWITWAKK